MQACRVKQYIRSPIYRSQLLLMPFSASVQCKSLPERPRAHASVGHVSLDHRRRRVVAPAERRRHVCLLALVLEAGGGGAYRLCELAQHRVEHALGRAKVDLARDCVHDGRVEQLGRLAPVGRPPPQQLVPRPRLERVLQVGEEGRRLLVVEGVLVRVGGHLYKHDGHAGVNGLEEHLALELGLQVVLECARCGGGVLLGVREEGGEGAARRVQRLDRVGDTAFDEGAARVQVAALRGEVERAGAARARARVQCVPVLHAAAAEPDEPLHQPRRAGYHRVHQQRVPVGGAVAQQRVQEDAGAHGRAVAQSRKIASPEARRRATAAGALH
eukprot:4339874-Pleurochrysis_carterae.AAC.2